MYSKILSCFHLVGSEVIYRSVNNSSKILKYPLFHNIRHFRLYGSSLYHDIFDDKIKEFTVRTSISHKEK